MPINPNSSTFRTTSGSGSTVIDQNENSYRVAQVNDHELLSLTGDVGTAEVAGKKIGIEFMLDNVSSAPLTVSLVLKESGGTETVLQKQTVANGRNNITLYGEAATAGDVYVEVKEAAQLGEVSVNSTLAVQMYDAYFLAVTLMVKLYLV